MNEWYYAVNNNQNGPISEEELKSLFTLGEISKDTLVWTEGMDDWQPLGSVSSLEVQQAPSIAKKQNKNPSHEVKSLSYAGFWLRAVAFIIDFIILFIAIIFLGGAILALSSDINPEDIESITTFILVFVGWLYYAIWESSEHQATLGKKIIGIKVTNEDGEQIGFGEASGRYFGKIVSGLILYIGYIMAAFTDKKQALHDMMAGCLVVKTKN